MVAEPLELQVDEDGFVCIVAPETYEGFVDEDWTLDSLLARFVEQTNRGSLFVAYPGPDHAHSRLTLATVPPETRSAREASGIVQVGSAGLWLTDYTQLTMAAQFSDQPPIANYSRRIPAAPGRCLVTLYEVAGESPFMLTLSPASPDTVMEQLSVPWFE